ncbi:NADH-quinone oxidoreductase subunit J [Nocardioidaceae bacterium]|nr:NADH-quinone oxidoreductase subunit J [Nocardioidaceae bacterium]
MIGFWLLAPFMVAAALGVVLVRKAVHSALLLASVMVMLAVMYLTLDAPFLFAIQIIVYTGAILMLFIFVLMLVGVDASDSLVETIPGQRLAAAVLGLVFGASVVIAVSQVGFAAVVGFEDAELGNVEGLASLLFSRYVIAFELTAALLITASVGAMVLAHRERLEPKLTQADRSRQRMRDFAETGASLGAMPSPGVYARHNAVDTPALLPDGTPASASVSASLTARGDMRPAADLADDLEELTREMNHEKTQGTHRARRGGAGGTTEELQ